MISGGHHERRREQLAGHQLAHDQTEDGVHIGHLSIIEPVSALLSERGGRIVRQMGIEEMDPDEERSVAARVFVEPRLERLKHLLGPALGVGRFERRVRLEIVVVDVEPAVQAEAGIHGEGRRESGRFIAAALEDLGQGRSSSPESVGSVVVDAVGIGIFAGHDRGVRRQGEGNLAVGLAEADSALGQDVQIGGPARGIPVAAKPVGPGRVQGDEDHVQPGVSENRNGLGPRRKKDAGRAGEERRPGQAEKKTFAPRPRGGFGLRRPPVSGARLPVRGPSGAGGGRSGSRMFLVGHV